MVRIMAAAAPSQAAAYLALVLSQAGIPAASLYVVKVLIDLIVDGGGTGDVQPLLVGVLAFCGIQLYAAIASQLTTYVHALYQLRLTDYISRLVLEQAARVPYSYYETPAYHDTLHLAQQQALYKSAQVLSGLSTFLLQGTTLVMVGGMMVWYYWPFAVLLCAVSLPLLLVKGYFARQTYVEETKLSSLERESGYLHQVLTGLTYAKEVRLFGFASPFIDAYSRLRTTLFQRRRGVQNRMNAYTLAVSSLEIVAVGVLFFLLARNTWTGAISTGLFVLYLQGFPKVQSSTRQTVQAVVNLFQLRLFVQHLFGFLDLETAPAPARKPFPPDAQALEVRHLTFSYPNARKPVLQDVSLSCRRGQIVAIVGENGSGKSTLVKLLGQLYPAPPGTIWMGGTPLEDIAPDAFRSRSVFLFQDFEKYFLPVGDTIRLGLPNDETTPERLHRAAVQSGAMGFIEHLERGFDTRLGRSFLRGTQLSGGQWQKLALARVFYREADLVVLDEPTSALDALAESALYDALRAWGQDRMILLITHRLPQLKQADRIYVMHEGKIIEAGPFDRLVAQRGYFFRLFQQQL